MNENATDLSSDAPCEECLAWQKLLDEELNMEAAELLLHHLKSCRACAGTVRGLKQTKSFCEEQLGFEDEGGEEFSRQVLTRVRLRIETAQPARHPAPFNRRWRLYAAAAMMALILVALVLWPSLWRQTSVSGAGRSHLARARESLPARQGAVLGTGD